MARKIAGSSEQSEVQSSSSDLLDVYHPADDPDDTALQTQNGTSEKNGYEVSTRVNSVTGATQDEVSLAEQTFGVRINGGYRDFLVHFGWGGVEHLELHGLV